MIVVFEEFVGQCRIQSPLSDMKVPVLPYVGMSNGSSAVHYGEGYWKARAKRIHPGPPCSLLVDHHVSQTSRVLLRWSVSLVVIVDLLGERYAADVGSYTYGTGHVMKPHRMRITHDLVTAYGLLDKMQVLVRTFSPSVNQGLTFDASPCNSDHRNARQNV
jgi:hypothetical protein